VNVADWSFNFFYSFPYWISFLIFALAARLVASSPKWKALFLGMASSLMLLAVPRFGLQDLGLVLALSVLTYIIGRLLTRGAFPVGGLQKKLIAAAGIMAVLAFLAFFKYRFVQAFFLPGLASDGGGSAALVRMIGVSYFSFRMLHFLIESYRGKIQGLSPLTYINYIIFFPAFISGPINRYNHFASQFSLPVHSRLWEDLKKGGERIIHGLFKKFVLAQILYPYILSTQTETLAQMRFYEVVLGLYAYAFYFYFDFSGYTDLAIGCARVIGIELQENFNNPFLKKNIRELWTNWHISLTGWLVDYIYWPVVRKLRGLEYFRRHPVFLSNLGMIITFIICGMWHGESANFVLWGAYHGVGISILTIYQREKRKAKSTIIQRYFRSKTSMVVGIFLTFHFFALGLSLFVLDMEKLRVLLTGIWPAIGF
jgi:alginate O-acetyltransferase complex protein AlgI